MKKTEIRRMVTAAAAACEDKKAQQIRILELDPADSGFTDYFLICSGANDRQNQAIADEIELRMKRDFGNRVNSVEGYRQGDWVLLDYVDFVVHIFSEEKRAFYDIERLRKTAHPLTLEELKASLVKKTAAARKKSTAKPSIPEPATKSRAKKPSAKLSTAKKPSSGKKSAVRKTASTRTLQKNSFAKKTHGR